MERNRVYAVGMGVVTPIGITVESMWNNLLNGVSGTQLNTFNTYGYGLKDFNPVIPGLEHMVTAEVKDFNPLDWMDKKTIRREPPFCWFALAAARQAIAQANLKITDSIRNRMVVFIGSGIGGLITLEHEHTVLMQKGAEHVSAFTIPRIMANAATSIVARDIGCNGAGGTPVSACATGADAIGQAFRLIQHGYADVAIAGGTETVITPLALAGFKNMHALAEFTEDINDPQQLSRPFDRDRNGFVMGEGAGVLVLASSEFVVKQNLNALARVVGYASTQDAYHVTAPDPNGTYAANAMRLALQDGRVALNEVVYINPHGTGTPTGDPIEVRAIKSVFGDLAFHIPISSSKCMLGHMIGAAGAVEAIISILTLLYNKAHMVINLDHIDPECVDLDYILQKPRVIFPGAVVSNSFGFGGLNATLVFLPV